MPIIHECGTHEKDPEVDLKQLDQMMDMIQNYCGCSQETNSKNNYVKEKNIADMSINTLKDAAQYLQDQSLNPDKQKLIANDPKNENDQGNSNMNDSSEEIKDDEEISIFRNVVLEKKESSSEIPKEIQGHCSNILNVEQPIIKPKANDPETFNDENDPKEQPEENEKEENINQNRDCNYWKENYLEILEKILQIITDIILHDLDKSNYWETIKKKIQDFLDLLNSPDNINLQRIAEITNDKNLICLKSLFFKALMMIIHEKYPKFKIEENFKQYCKEIIEADNQWSLLILEQFFISDKTKWKEKFDKLLLKCFEQRLRESQRELKYLKIKDPKVEKLFIKLFNQLRNLYENALKNEKLKEKFLQNLEKGRFKFDSDVVFSIIRGDRGGYYAIFYNIDHFEKFGKELQNCVSKKSKNNELLIGDGGLGKVYYMICLLKPDYIPFIGAEIQLGEMNCVKKTTNSRTKMTNFFKVFSYHSSSQLIGKYFAPIYDSSIYKTKTGYIGYTIQKLVIHEKVTFTKESNPSLWPLYILSLCKAIEMLMKKGIFLPDISPDNFLLDTIQQQGFLIDLGGRLVIVTQEGTSLKVNINDLKKFGPCKPHYLKLKIQGQ